MANKKYKLKFNKTELIVTIIVLIASLVLGFLLGKSMFDKLY